MPNVLANAIAKFGELWCRARVIVRSGLTFDRIGGTVAHVRLTLLLS
jgi:hypothetical protein